MVAQKAPAERTSAEVELDVRDRELFFVRASEAASCTVELERMVHRSDGRLLEYFTVEGATPERVIETAEGASEIDTVRLVRDSANEALFEFLVSGPCIGATLADVGAVIRTVKAVDGVGRVIADVPSHVETRQVIEEVSTSHQVDVVSKRARDRAGPEFTAREFRETLADQLTERQMEILSSAYASGYFNWPRDSSGEECAEALGISQPTFAEHLRVGQQKLLQAVLDDAVAGEVDR